MMTAETLLFFCLLALLGPGDTNGPEVIRVVEDEGSDVILPCSPSTKENLETTAIDWKKGDQEVFFCESNYHYNNGRHGQDEQFKGRVLYYQDELKNGNGSIKIQNAKVSDSGTYTCTFPHLQPRQVFHVELVIHGILKDRLGEIKGASPVPYIKTLNATKAGTQLQCEVPGAFPKPEVEWQDRAGNVLPAEKPQVSERGGRYYIILLTTVTKTDLYRCVVTQKDISHQTSFETNAIVNEELCQDSSSSVTWLSVAVFALVLAAGLGAWVAILLCRIRRYKNAARGPVGKASEETHRLNSRLENKDSHQQTNGHGTHLEEEPV